MYIIALMRETRFYQNRVPTQFRVAAAYPGRLRSQAPYSGYMSGGFGVLDLSFDSLFDLVSRLFLGLA
jgi:hypothetical protein